MTKRELRYLINAAVLIVAVLCLFIMRFLPHQGKPLPGKDSFFYASRVIDGDTIKLSNGEHVRLIGIDTPEARYNNKLARDSERSHKDMDSIIKMGKQASDFTRRLVEGRQIRLEFDVERRDKYHRLLAYVYLEDGTFVNAKIMEEGYAQVMTIPPNVRYADLFLKLQKDARKNGRGLWKEGAAW